MTKERVIKCKKCKENNWKAYSELDDDITTIYLVCKCSHVWTAQLE